MNIEKQEIEEKLNVKRLDKNKDIKIKFLQEQNSNLREQNKDLQENLKINKETFDLMLKNECSSQNIKIESKSILNKNLTDNMICYDETNNSHFQIKSLQKIIEKLFKENTKHLENINKLIIERNNAQTKVFSHLKKKNILKRPLSMN